MYKTQAACLRRWRPKCASSQTGQTNKQPVSLHQKLVEPDTSKTHLKISGNTNILSIIQFLLSKGTAGIAIDKEWTKNQKPDKEDSQGSLSSKMASECILIYQATPTRLHIIYKIRLWIKSWGEMLAKVFYTRFLSSWRGIAVQNS